VTFPVEIVTHSNKHVDLTLNLQRVQEIKENAVEKTEALTELDTGLTALLQQVDELAKMETAGGGGEVKIDVAADVSEDPAEIARLKAIDVKQQAISVAKQNIRSKAQSLQYFAKTSAAKDRESEAVELMNLYEKTENNKCPEKDIRNLGPLKGADIQAAHLKGTCFLCSLHDFAGSS
jgi:hypothetical protein